MPGSIEMPMRERIARAMYEGSMRRLKKRFPVQYEESITDETWEGAVEETHQHWLAAVDDALDKLMKPTIGMIDAGIGEPMRDENDINCFRPYGIKEGFQVIIRTAKDGK